MSNCLTFADENYSHVICFKGTRRYLGFIWELPCATYATNLNYLCLQTGTIHPVTIIIRNGRGTKVARFSINDKLYPFDANRIHYDTSRLSINGNNFIFTSDIISAVLKHVHLRTIMNYENATKSAASAKAISDKLAILREIYPEHLI